MLPSELAPRSHRRISHSTFTIFHASPARDMHAVDPPVRVDPHARHVLEDVAWGRPSSGIPGGVAGREWLHAGTPARLRSCTML